MKIKSNENELCKNVEIVTSMSLVPKIDATIIVASMSNAMYGIELSGAWSCKHAQ